MRYIILKYLYINFKFIIIWKIYYVLVWDETRVKEIEVIYKYLFIFFIIQSVVLGIEIIRYFSN